ncbi:MAG: hypothetical protein ACR2M1_05590 [Gemmatimonadaceae bacterium]
MPKLIDRAPSRGAAFTPSFDCDVNADLLPVLEAVGDGPCRIVDRDRDAIDYMLLDP